MVPLNGEDQEGTTTLKWTKTIFRVMTCILNIQQGTTLTLFLLGEFFPKFLGGFFRTHLKCWWLKSGTLTSWARLLVYPPLIYRFFQLRTTHPFTVIVWPWDFWLPSTVWHHPSYQTFRIRNISVSLPPPKKKIQDSRSNIHTTPHPPVWGGIFVKNNTSTSPSINQLSQKKTNKNTNKSQKPNISQVFFTHHPTPPAWQPVEPSLWLFVPIGDHRVWRNLRWSFLQLALH